MIVLLILLMLLLLLPLLLLLLLAPRGDGAKTKTNKKSPRQAGGSMPRAGGSLPPYMYSTALFLL